MTSSRFIADTNLAKILFLVQAKREIGDFTSLFGLSAWGDDGFTLALFQKFNPNPYCLMHSILNFFIEGGLAFMSILTVLLVAIFFAAWKAPRWVKEIGLFALLFGFLGTILGLLQVLDVMGSTAASAEGTFGVFDAIPLGVFFGGLKVTLNTTIYGICIYLVSLVVRVIQKPRI